MTTELMDPPETITEADAAACAVHVRRLDGVLRALRLAGLEGRDRYRELALEREACAKVVRREQQERMAQDLEQARARRDGRDRLEEQRAAEREREAARAKAREWLEERALFAPGRMLPFETTMGQALEAGLDPAVVASVGFRVQRKSQAVVGGYLALSDSYSRRDFYALGSDGRPVE